MCGFGEVSVGSFAQAERLETAGAVEERGHAVRRACDRGRKLGLGLLAFVQSPEGIASQQPQGPQLGGLLAERGIRFPPKDVGTEHVERPVVRRAKLAVCERARLDVLFEFTLERTEASALPVRGARRGRGSGRQPPWRSSCCASCSIAASASLSRPARKRALPNMIRRPRVPAAA